MWSWGNDDYGQVGLGSHAYFYFPAQVSSLSSIQAISAGANFSMALASDGTVWTTVWTWGDNSYGELGDGTQTQRTAPVQVAGLSGVIAISAGDSYCLAVKSDGTVWGWGYGGDGELGGGVNYIQNTPVQLGGVNSIVAVAGGGQHALALGADGTLWGWGTNSRGQLGTGTTSGVQLPAPIGAINDAVAIAAGEQHSLALRGDGTIRAWGDNTYGQLSDAATGSLSAVPVEIAGITDAVAIALIIIDNFSAGSGHKPSATIGCLESIARWCQQIQAGSICLQPVSSVDYGWFGFLSGGNDFGLSRMYCSKRSS